MLVLRVVWSIGLVTHRHLGCGNGSDAQTVPRRPSWGQGSNEIVLRAYLDGRSSGWAMAAEVSAPGAFGRGGVGVVEDCGVGLPEEGAAVVFA